VKDHAVFSVLPDVHYVYILESLGHPTHFYAGSTADLKLRLADHNSGRSPHTSKFRPWKLKWYAAFETKEKAEGFEGYLKSGSGRVFQRKRLA